VRSFPCIQSLRLLMNIQIFHNPCTASIIIKMRSACFDNAVQNILGNFDKSQNLGFKIQYFSFSQDPVKNVYTDNPGKIIPLNSFIRT